MPEHLFTVVARGHAVDAQTNNLTLFSVLEEVAGSNLPFAVPDTTIVTLWKRRDAEEGVTFIQRTRLIDPEGNEVFHGDSTFRLDKPRHRNIVTVEMAPFFRAGCYRVEVLIRRDDEEKWSSPVASYPIEISARVPAAREELFEEPTG